MSSISRKTPQNLTAEKHLLGAILIDPEAMNLVASKLVPTDFFSQKNGEIWKAMTTQYNKGEPNDLVTLSPYMSNEAGSSAYLLNLMAESRGPTHIESYAEAIKGASRRRGILQAAARMVSMSYEESDASTAENMAKEILMSAIGDADHNLILSPSSQATILRDYIRSKRTSGNPTGVESGYPTLDNMCGGGLRRGDLIVIAARTSVGKSSLAENIAEHVAFDGKTVLFVSIEMSPEQMMYRYAIRSGELSRSAVEFGIDNEEDEQALERLSAKRAAIPFHLMNSPSATTTTVRSAISKIRMSEGGVDLVLIDYLQLLKDRTRQEERLNIGEMTSSLKAMAREFEVPIVLLSQLNRNIEYRGGEPQLADLRESGRIEEDSDVVLLLWKTAEEDAIGNSTKMKVAKNRQGPTGPVNIVFHQPSFRFTER